MDRRRFSLAHGMILIAASAVGMALMRLFFQSASRVSVGGNPFYNAQLNLFSFSPMLMVWSITLLFLQLRQPRSPIRELAGTPGFGAVCATACVTIVHFSRMGIEAILDPKHSFLAEPFFILFSSMVPFVTLSIVPVWLLVALGGRWNRSMDWRERLGRVVGWSWIVLNLSTDVARYFS